MLESHESYVREFESSSTAHRRFITNLFQGVVHVVMNDALKQ